MYAEFPTRRCRATGGDFSVRTLTMSKSLFGVSSFHKKNCRQMETRNENPKLFTDILQGMPRETMGNWLNYVVSKLHWGRSWSAEMKARQRKSQSREGRHQAGLTMGRLLSRPLNSSSRRRPRMKGYLTTWMIGTVLSTPQSSSFLWEAFRWRS